LIQLLLECLYLVFSPHDGYGLQPYGLGISVHHLGVGRSSGSGDEVLRPMHLRYMHLDASCQSIDAGRGSHSEVSVVIQEHVELERNLRVGAPAVSEEADLLPHIALVHVVCHIDDGA